MIKAIIFDCFGVLTDSSFEPFKLKHLAHNHRLVVEAEMLDQEACLGNITHEKLMSEFARLANISKSKVLEEFSGKQRNIELLTYIKTDLKSKYRIGLLSNAADDWLDVLFHAEEIAMFDNITLSCNVGLIKPDPRVFQQAAKNLGVTTEECLFVDDSEVYLSGAKKTGMSTILYSDFKSFNQELCRIL